MTSHRHRRHRRRLQRRRRRGNTFPGLTVPPARAATVDLKGVATTLTTPPCRGLQGRRHRRLLPTNLPAPIVDDDDDDYDDDDEPPTTDPTEGSTVEAN